MYLKTYSLVIFLAIFSTIRGLKVEFVPNLATTIYLDEVKEINFTIIFENDDSNRKYIEPITHYHEIEIMNT